VNRPSARSGHTLATAGTSAFLFGGIELKQPAAPNNDLFLVDLQNKGELTAGAGLIRRFQATGCFVVLTRSRLEQA
jgi:hypothetical protein